MTLKYTEIEWVDSCSAEGWMELPSDFSTVICKTVAIVVKEDAEQLILASSYDEDNNNWMGLISIPNVAIKSRIDYIFGGR